MKGPSELGNVSISIILRPSNKGSQQSGRCDQVFMLTQLSVHGTLMVPSILAVMYTRNVLFNLRSHVMPCHCLTPLSCYIPRLCIACSLMTFSTTFFLFLFPLVPIYSWMQLNKVVLIKLCMHSWWCIFHLTFVNVLMQSVDFHILLIHTQACEWPFWL